MARYARTVLVAAATLVLAACGGDEQATPTQEPEGGGEVGALVEAFMKARQASLPAYAGWRVGINADGKWVYFISGD
jgi:hypothetical protein